MAMGRSPIFAIGTLADFRLDDRLSRSVRSNFLCLSMLVAVGVLSDDA